MMKPKTTLKEQFEWAKTLIQRKQYVEARALLRMIDHPTAHEWLAKLDKIAPMKVSASSPVQIKAKTRGPRIWRTIWGILTLLSLGWMCYGLTVSSQAYMQTTAGTTSEAGKAGAAIGASLGLGTFICIGLPFLLVFLFLYSRAGSAIRHEQMHAEMLEAVQSKNVP
jgi:hypothetical protein